MHIHTLENWQHSHEFSVKNDKGEKRTQYVLVLTAITMVVEIIAGSVYGSMALLADGWHMGTHVAAFVIALFAYRYARKHAHNPAYTFGTGKVNVLGGFASAIALAVVAVVMMLESLQRIVDPRTIHYNEAILVASIGLFINVVSAYLLKENHSHDHHGDHTHHHQDHNLRAAYFHVLADAMTCVLAIVALVFGRLWGWNWLDPIIGIVGAIIIVRWSYGLIKQTSPILLDGSIDEAYKRAIKETIEKDSDNRIFDIHVWKVGANDYAAIIALVTHYPKSTEHYKILLKNFDKLSHVTIEVNECRENPCTVPNSKTS
jgi:cation diffusion facilitator family transporter